MSQDCVKYFDCSEEELWQSLAAGPGAKEFSQAVAHAQNGKFHEAFTALAEYHRSSHSQWWLELQRFAESYQDYDHNNPQQGRKLAFLPEDEERIVSMLNLSAKEKAKLDLEVDATCGGELVARLVRGEGDRDHLRRVLSALLLLCYDARHHSAYFRFPLTGQLGGHSQIRFFFHSYMALNHTGGIDPEVASALLRIILG
ncbi:MAG: hypothetical protein ACYTGH_17850, partial [Planctomycetota bacterium]